MRLGGGTHWCFTCGRVRIPKRIEQCAGCRSNISADVRSNGPRRCGRQTAKSLHGCGGFVPAGGRCDRCGQ